MIIYGKNIIVSMSTIVVILNCLGKSLYGEAALGDGLSIFLTFEGKLYNSVLCDTVVDFGSSWN